MQCPFHERAAFVPETFLTTHTELSMKILVTGAAGFIGSHLTESLLANNHQVVGLDNFDDYYDRAIKERNLKAALAHSHFSLVRGDILDTGLFDGALAGHPFDVVVHLAAKAGVRPSIKDPLRYFKTNVEGTLNILEFCKNNSIPKLVFASSSSVYGNNEKVPFAETDNVDNPISPYAASKKAGELLCYNYHHLYGVHVYALRFFTAYGPRQRPDMAIHKFTKLISEGKPIQLYGDGDLRRDFTYIDDIIQGVMNSINRVSGFEVINLGESKTIRVAELVGLIETYLGKRAIVELRPIPPGDVKETFADISKARRLIHYAPSVGIESGIQRFLKWYNESHHNLT
jgi:UDP-glucuronate 4-epimerase